MAYLTRVGHQSLTIIMALELDDALAYAEALGRLIERENGEE